MAQDGVQKAEKEQALQHSGFAVRHAVQPWLDFADAIFVHSLPLQAVCSSLRRLPLFYFLCGFGV